MSPLLDVLECSSIVRSTTTGHVCIRYVEYTKRESSSTSSCRSQLMLYKHRPKTLGVWNNQNVETFTFIENVGYCVPLFDQQLKRRVHESIVRDYTPKMIATAEEFLRIEDSMDTVFFLDALFLSENNEKILFIPGTKFLNPRGNTIPMYMAQEKLKDDALIVPEKLIVYALGMCVYILLHGDPSKSLPLNPSIVKFFYKLSLLKSGEFIGQFGPHVTKEAIQFIMGCCEVDVTKRWTLAECLASDFVRNTNSD
eukprot:PhF_6_TR2316/c0_g1_i9/m.4095